MTCKGEPQTPNRWPLRRPRPFPPPCRMSRYPGLRLRCRPLRNLWPRLDYRLDHNRLGHRLGRNRRLRLRSLPSLPRQRLPRPSAHRSRCRLRQSLRHP
jgi:hypothetical protein